MYAHSIHFGTKGCGNLVQTAVLMDRIAAALEVPVGPLELTVRSAHIYAPDLAAMRGILATGAPQTKT